MRESDPFETGADVFFLAKDTDWRNELDDEDPDDEQIETPEDVIAVLGFDPAEDDDESDDDDESTQFAEDSTNPDANEIIALGTSESVRRIRRAKRDIANLVKKKA